MNLQYLQPATRTVTSIVITTTLTSMVSSLSLPAASVSKAGRPRRAAIVGGSLGGLASRLCTVHPLETSVSTICSYRPP